MTNYFGDALRKGREKKQKTARRMDVAYPSDASVELRIGEEVQIHGGCLRAQYYRITEAPQTDPESADRSFVAEMGNVAHDAVANVFREAEQLLKTELQVWIPTIRLSGRIDVLFRVEAGGRTIGCEVKSVGGYNGRKGVIEPRRGCGLYPKIYHLAQTVVYADFLKDQIQEWIILYVDRETGAWREHQVLYRGHDDILVNGEPATVTPKAVYARWERMWALVDAKTVPPRDYQLRYPPERIARLAELGELNKDEKERFNAGRKVDKGDRQCREFCAWRTHCWKSEAPATA
jgi:hypothetical protein